MRILLPLLFLAPLLMAAAPAAGLVIKSPAFSHGGPIPSRFTCEGTDISPALQFSDAPKGTKTLALIVSDPDAPDPAAPQRIWTHWVLYDMPAGTHGLAEAGDSQLPAGTRVGKNDWGKARWGGPCPPIGRHRYFFRLYALDSALGDLHEPDRAALEKAMEGHVLAYAELMGTYEKEKK